MKLTIFKRVLIGYLAIMLLVVCLGAFLTVQLNRLNRLAWTATSIDGEIIRIAQRLSNGLPLVVNFQMKYLVSSDADFHKRYTTYRAEALVDIDKLETLLNQAQRTDLARAIGTSRQLFFSLLEKDIAALQIKNTDTSYRNDALKEQSLDEINNQLSHIISTADSDRDTKLLSCNQISTQVLRTTTTAALLCIILGMWLSVFHTRKITRPIEMLQDKTREFAHGKFIDIQNIKSPPEILELAEDFNEMGNRLRKLDEMKEDFIRHVSHGLRTPLTAIREASSMLLDEPFPKISPKGNELLTIVRDECERLIASVNQMLDLSRMEAGMMEYRFELTDLTHILRNCILKLAPLAHGKRLSLSLTPLGQLPRVRIDREQIQQVLENLLGNAINFTDPEGEVTVSATHEQENQNRIVVTICDTGCGIHAYDLKKIFEKFKRIENGSAIERGTGLGLTISKHIITAHGGEIWVQSEPGVGSTFYFALPVA